MTTMLQDPDELSRRAMSLHDSALFDEGETVLTPEAEAHFLLAVSSLETAARHFKLAHYAEMKKR